MKLYSGPLSLFSRKVEIALAEKSLRFERQMVAFTQTAGYSPKHPAVLAANPKAQVPVLIDGDLTLFDSTVILEYLEDAYPDPPLYPASPAARARCRMLELFADEILLIPIRSLMHRSEPVTDTARRERQEAEATRGEAEIRKLYDELDARLGAADYFCDSFSVADIGLFMCVLFAERLKGPRPGGHPRLAAWYGRMSARPSCAKVAAEMAAADRELSPTLFA
jgi:glutathione S-transferase